MSDEQKDFQPYQPDPNMAEQLALLRNGRLVPIQRSTIIIGALGSAFGLICTISMMFSVGSALISDLGQAFGVGIFFFAALFFLAFGYLGLTAYFNMRMFLPDMVSKRPVAHARGKLEIKIPERSRGMMPFSYIVGDYSFGPFMIEDDIPMQTGREYIVYYARNSRMFLGIEPLDYAQKQPGKTPR